MTNANGVDVSHFQGDIDWSAVRGSGVAFAFAKATQGTSYVDPKFPANWAGMGSAGVVRGAYHFFEAADDPAAQARHFVSTVGTWEAGDLAPVVDVEQGGGTPTVSSVQAFLDAVEQATQRTPMIYVSPSFAAEHLGDGFGRYPLWVAEYGVSSPRVPAGWSTWTFWQHSDGGTVPGVPGGVDLDYHNGPLTGTPAPPAESSQQPQPSGQTYTVQAGDTLAAIAARFGTTVAAIAAANDIADPDFIRVGEVLQIPEEAGR